MNVEEQQRGVFTPAHIHTRPVGRRLIMHRNWSCETNVLLCSMACLLSCIRGGRSIFTTLSFGFLVPRYVPWIVSRGESISATRDIGRGSGSPSDGPGYKSNRNRFRTDIFAGTNHRCDIMTCICLPAHEIFNSICNERSVRSAISCAQMLITDALSVIYRSLSRGDCDPQMISRRRSFLGLEILWQKLEMHKRKRSDGPSIHDVLIIQLYW